MGGCKLILKTLTGLKVLVFKDLGFLTAICMYPQIGSKQKMSVNKNEAALKISMPFMYPWLNNSLMNYLMWLNTI